MSVCLLPVTLNGLLIEHYFMLDSNFLYYTLILPSTVLYVCVTSVPLPPYDGWGRGLGQGCHQLPPYQRSKEPHRTPCVFIIKFVAILGGYTWWLYLLLFHT